MFVRFQHRGPTGESIRVGINNCFICIVQRYRPSFNFVYTTNIDLQHAFDRALWFSTTELLSELLPQQPRHGEVSAQDKVIFSIGECTCITGFRINATPFAPVAISSATAPWKAYFNGQGSLNM